MARAQIATKRAPQGPSRKTLQSTTNFRRDIQGLRAFAVLVVFLDHMIGWPHGGFVGVDMFFVISGFLITGLLIREYTSTGTISFKRFYVARAKRIIPAATLVLVVATLLGFVVFSGTRALATAWDSLWAFLFAANWNFAILGTDYFSQDSALSPVQHYWSLSVEEQFYFVWPWLLLGLLAIVARFGTMTSRRTRVVAAITIGIIGIASFVWALHEATTSPTMAYFSTLTRTWELGLGALLAVAAPLFLRLGASTRVVLAYVGLVGMVISVFVVTPETPWPAPWALVPTIATALVLASGIGQEARFLLPLTNPVAFYIGNISYSLYLWHFPAIVFGLALFPNSGSFGFVGIIIAGFGLAIAAYHLVEKPLHKSPLLTRIRPRDKVAAWQEWRSKNGRQATLGGLLGAGVATLTLVAVALTPPAAPAVQAEVTSILGDDVQSESTAPETDAIAAEVRTALSGTAWPELQPDLDSVELGKNPEMDVSLGCLNPEFLVAGQCTTGLGPKNAIIVGDSFSVAWTPAIRATLEPQGFSVQTVGYSTCPFTTADVKLDLGEAASERCNSSRSAVTSHIVASAPDLLIILDSEYAMAQTANIPAGGAARSQAYASARVDAVRATGIDPSKVVIVTPNPGGLNPTACGSKVGSPADCVSDVAGPYAELEKANQSAAGTLGAQTLSTQTLFCASGKCPVYAGSTLIRWDSGHLTSQYAEHIVPALTEMLVPMLPA
ncbi:MULTISPECIES: acyltransferase family protein [unclassified Pseudoclavibacter]|uniref:acyltransferase family protein n=1 Tax=unclassified Pseudoclavibacter TaxID=2615177 RepID=UPI001BA819E1|nr:acyltransferase family protein [Pseudoclavibacter sp. Marseille-Q4354]MBS3180078.1 acyltransferase [Pseudoclavibacter sp. Marseille-Q4354]